MFNTTTNLNTMTKKLDEIPKNIGTWNTCPSSYDDWDVILSNSTVVDPSSDPNSILCNR